MDQCDEDNPDSLATGPSVFNFEAFTIINNENCLI